MSVTSFIQNRFNRIRDEDGIAVLSVRDRATGADRYLIVSVLQTEGFYVVAPIGEVFDEHRQTSIMDEVIEP